MHTTRESAPPELITAAYARSRPGVLSRWRSRKKYWIGGLVFLGAAAVATSLTAPGVFRRLAGTSAYDGDYHTVEPSNLVITLSEDGELKPRESVKIKCEVEGQSSILFVVPESSQVKKGDLLVELTSDELDERLRAKELELKSLRANAKAAEKELELQKSQNASNIKKAQIDLEVARLDLEKYVKGDYKGKLEQIDLQIRQSEEEIERKQRDLDENVELLKKGWVNANTVDELRFQLTVANWQLDQHKLAREILLNYDHPKEMKQRESAVERADEELGREQERAGTRVDKLQADVDKYHSQLVAEEDAAARLRKQIEQCKMYAPSDGIVQYPSDEWWRNDNRIAVGERVYKGQTLLELPDTSQMMVKIRIHEADRHMVKEGMPCVIKVAAAPGKTFTGKLSKIDKFVDTENRWLNPNLKEHGAEILLDATEVALSPGESAEVKILVGTLDNVLAAPVQCVYTRGRRSFVFVGNDGTPAWKEVQLGASNATMVEVSDGLKSGDRVLMDADEQLLATLPTVQPDTEAPPPATSQPAEAAPAVADATAAAAPDSGGDKADADDAKPETTKQASTEDTSTAEQPSKP